MEVISQLHASTALFPGKEFLIFVG